MYLIKTDTINTPSELYWRAGDGWVASFHAATDFKVSSYHEARDALTSLLVCGLVVTKGELVQLIASNHSSGKWLNGTFYLYRPDKPLLAIGVKAFGKWVQRMEVKGKPYWSGAECKTVSTFKSAVEAGIDYLCLEN